MVCGSGGSKSRLAKAAGAEPSGQMRDEKVHAVVARSTCRSQHVQSTRAGPLLEVAMSKKCTPLWREAHLEVKMRKTPQCRTNFGSCDVEKVHAVVARSTCRSQNVQYTPGPDHFWQLRCRTSARCCGANQISKSNRTKNTRVGPLLEVAMSKKCTPLWREAHFEVKMYNTHQVRTTFGGSAVLSRGRRKRLCTLPKVSQTWSFLAFSTTTTAAPHYTPIRYISTTTTPSLNSTALHYNALHYTPLHSIALNHAQLHYPTLRYTTRHDTTLHSTTLHYTALHCTTLHYTTLHYTTPHMSTSSNKQQKKGKDGMGKAGKRKEMVKDWCGVSCVWKSECE